MKAAAIGAGLLVAYLLARLANFVFGLAGNAVYFVFDLVTGAIRIAFCLGIVAGLVWLLMHQAEVMRITSTWIRSWP